MLASPFNTFMGQMTIGGLGTRRTVWSVLVKDPESATDVDPAEGGGEASVPNDEKWSLHEKLLPAGAAFDPWP